MRCEVRSVPPVPPLGAHLWVLFHKRIATCRIAESQIAEGAHWPLPWKHIATANACVLQFAILQFCKLQFFYEIGPRSGYLSPNVADVRVAVGGGRQLLRDSADRPEHGLVCSLKLLLGFQGVNLPSSSGLWRKEPRTERRS